MDFSIVYHRSEHHVDKTFGLNGHFNNGLIVNSVSKKKKSVRYCDFDKLIGNFCGKN